MDFSETDEQIMIREMVRAFAEDVLSKTVEERDKMQKSPLDEWNAFCELGLQGSTIPEKYGGYPLDDISEAIIIEELARIDPSFSVFYAVHVGLCSKTIALHADEDQKEKYLRLLAEGKVGAYSLSEAGSGTDAGAMSAKATLSEDGEFYILNGEKNVGYKWSEC